jgi:hypothetical protein
VWESPKLARFVYPAGVLVEWLLIGAVLAAVVRLFGASDRKSVLVMATACTSALVCSALVQALRAPTPAAPIALGAQGFAGSNRCRSCHPAEYASWHASFHRSMTRTASLSEVASPELRRGERLRIESGGRSVELFPRSGALWARLPDPGVTAAAAADAYAASFRVAPERELPVALLTGSHHHQTFWVRGARSGELAIVPAVYVIDERRLIARRDAFLNPPDAAEQGARWNSNCVQCHAVAGAPEHDPAHDSFATSAAELGIACEACHGAAAEHVNVMQNPLARYAQRIEGGGSAHVVNPQKLAPERAAEVCGRCHSYFFPRDERDWWQHGFSKSYAPGDDLARAQLLLSPESLKEATAPALEASTESLFYGDGTIRVGGREYNGLVRSPCYERGRGKQKLTCLSCHSMHQGAPDDQLDPEKLGNRACSQCHQAEAGAVSAHTHHAASSPGSLCYNCHMPHLSYALLGAIRSHRISVPAFDATTRDKPNACNLCHLEQSEAWAAERARAWYGDESRFRLDRSPELPHEAPAGAVFALAGDAAVRVIAAAALGRRQSGRDALELRTQLLNELSKDEYAAVRAVAGRVRDSLPPSPSTPPALAPAVVRDLLKSRDRRPVTIAE